MLSPGVRVSTGHGTLVSSQYIADAWEKPDGPPGYPEVTFLDWMRKAVLRTFGAANQEVLDGFRGAPLVEVGTGNVAGFFYSAHGDWAECAVLDDFIANGWEVA